MSRFVLALFVLISNLCSTISSDDMLYDERDLQKCVDKIELIDYHQELEVNGIRFKCYSAGHAFGAAMFMLDNQGMFMKF